MALEIKGMTRSFRFKKGTEYITLQDPDPNISPDMIMNYYSNLYPELTTATVHGPVIREDMTVYEFKTTIGTKDKRIWQRTTEKRRNHVYDWTDIRRNSSRDSSLRKPKGKCITARKGRNGLRHPAVP